MRSMCPSRLEFFALLVCLGFNPACIENGVKPSPDSAAPGDTGQAPIDTGEPAVDSLADSDSAPAPVDTSPPIDEDPVDSEGDPCEAALLGPFLAVTVPAGSGFLAIAASNGDGTFAAPTTLDPGLGERASTLLIGDFDGDGADDILARGETSTHLYLLTWDPCALSWSATDLGMLAAHLETAADLNGDGALDLVGISDDWTSAGVWLGVGDGTFSELAGALDLSAVYSGYGVKASGHALDVTGDGVPDLVLADYASAGEDHSRLWLAAGVGDGTFEGPDYLGTVSTAVNGLDLADLDLDGQPEVLAGLDDDGDAGVLFLGPGIAGGFDTLDVLIDLNTSAESGTNNPGAGRVLAADWDGDGSPDPIVSYQEDPYAPTTNSLHLMTGLSDLSPDSVRELTEIGMVSTINFAVPLQD